MSRDLKTIWTGPKIDIGDQSRKRAAPIEDLQRRTTTVGGLHVKPLTLDQFTGLNVSKQIIFHE